MAQPRTVRTYHGTSSVYKDRLSNEGFRSSTRHGLWLGNGVYFFEEAPLHARRWAERIAKNIGGEPLIIEAELDLTDCLDLTDATHWPFIDDVWQQYSLTFEGEQLGIRALVDEEYKKTGVVGRNIVDGQLMNLSIAIYRETIAAQGKRVTTIRSAFIEGEPIFPNSWLFKEAHVVVVALEPAAIRKWRFLE